MSRRLLTVFAFGLGTFASSVGLSLISMTTVPAAAQEKVQNVRPRLDLIVVQEGDAKTDQEEKADQKNVYLELIQQKLRLISPELLERETEILRRELAEMEANRKLQDVETQLRQLIEQYPGSGAAERAKSMLEAGRRRNSKKPNDIRPDFNTPTNDIDLEPKPDGEFNRSPIYNVPPRVPVVPSNRLPMY